MTASSRHPNAVGALVASAAGDALGWPVEVRGNRVGGFRDIVPQMEFTSWTRRAGGPWQPHEQHIDAGTYSDDTQLTLAVARSLAHGADWWNVLTSSELAWWPQYELGGGGATRRAARDWQRAVPPWSGNHQREYWDAGGNGVAMRVLPHCWNHRERFDEVRRRVLSDGITTHGHPIALLGGLLQAYSTWRVFQTRGPLGWGELLADIRENLGTWARYDPTDLPTEWRDQQPRDYRRLWDMTVVDTLTLLDRAARGLEQGALSADHETLQEIGVFSRIGGAGTVSAVASAYLFSRHASDPRQGLLSAAFARGADSDTLAAMTGALLGALHGEDWLGPLGTSVLDASLLHSVAQGSPVDWSPPADLSRRRSFEAALNGCRQGDRLDLPFFGRCEVWRIRDLAGPSPAIREWWFRNQVGQTFCVKRSSKARVTPWVPLGGSPRRDTPQPDQSDRRTMAGLVLRVKDLEAARRFYTRILGLPVTRERSSGFTVAGTIAIDVAEDVVIPRQAHIGPSPMTVVVYADEGAYADILDRLTADGIRWQESNLDQAIIETRDTENNPVEIHRRGPRRPATTPT